MRTKIEMMHHHPMVDTSAVEVELVTEPVHPDLQVTVSEVQEFILCPQKWANVYVHRRQLDRPTAQALRIGTAVHQCLEQYMKGVRYEDTPELKDLLTDPEDSATIKSLTPLMLAWYDKYMEHEPPWTTVISAEQPLSIMLNDYQLIGTPDSVVEKDGTLWHVQHKTMGQSMPVATFAKALQRSFHENLYRWLIVSAYPDKPYGGTMLNAIRKMSIKRAEDDPMQGLHMEFLPISEGRSARTLADLLYYVQLLMDQKKSIKAQLENGADHDHVFVPQNRKACAGVYGNSLCEYLEVCNQWRSLWDNQYYVERDPLLRYR